MSETFDLAFDGSFLRRGFWLYVWEATTPTNEKLLYVGRTGDSSSANAQSPFNRMGQHLGVQPNSSMLRKHLGVREIDPESCKFRLVAHGPILDEAENLDAHRERRDRVASVEKALADAMTAAGYDVMNTVHCHRALDKGMWANVRAAFAAEFPALGAEPEGENQA